MLFLLNPFSADGSIYPSVYLGSLVVLSRLVPASHQGARKSTAAAAATTRSASPVAMVMDTVASTAVTTTATTTPAKQRSGRVACLSFVRGCAA